MRIWDIHPGYLNRQSLLGEHRELHAIISIIINNKKGYSCHPETIRWKNHLSGLKLRHELLVSEMKLRGFQHHTPISDLKSPLSFPAVFIDSPGKQFTILKEKYKIRESGRIPLPRSLQELWAQHKYSVMAHDPNYYRKIGPILANSPQNISFDEFALQLVIMMREKPKTGRLKNAVEHIWGYVSEFETKKEEHFNLTELLYKIQRSAFTNKIKYLIESTALSELNIWLT